MKTILTLLSIIVLNILVLPSQAQASHAPIDFITIHGRCIIVSFSESVFVLNHFPLDRGSMLKIRVRPVFPHTRQPNGRNDRFGRDRFGRDRFDRGPRGRPYRRQFERHQSQRFFQPPFRRNVFLNSIEYDSFSFQPSLTFNFSRLVSFSVIDRYSQLRIEINEGGGVGC